MASSGVAYPGPFAQQPWPLLLDRCSATAVSVAISYKKKTQTEQHKDFEERSR